MSELDDKASELARMLTRLQLTANAGQPALVLLFNVRSIERIAHELGALLEAAPPTASVRMDPTLGEAQAELLREYMDGKLQTPDSPADL